VHRFRIATCIEVPHVLSPPASCLHDRDGDPIAGASPMLLRPDAELTTFPLCLACFARFGIAVHHFILMSNHYTWSLPTTRERANFLRSSIASRARIKVRGK